MEKTNDKKKLTKGIICALIGGTCWGFSGTCGQYLFDEKGIDAMDLTVIRLLCSGVILIIVSFFINRERFFGIWKNKRAIARVVAFGVFGLSVCQFTYLYAISFSNAGIATTLQYLGIAFVMLAVCVMEKRKPKVAELIALFLAIAGAFVLATHLNLTSLYMTPAALIWGLLAAVALMLYTLLPGSLLTVWGSPLVCGWGMLFGGIVLFFVTGSWNIRISWDPGTIAGFSGIILIGTVLAFTLYMMGIENVGPVKTSMLACIEPVAATVFSAVFLNTKFVAMDIVGLAMIIGSVLIISSVKK